MGDGLGHALLEAHLLEHLQHPFAHEHSQEVVSQRKEKAAGARVALSAAPRGVSGAAMISWAVMRAAAMYAAASRAGVMYASAALCPVDPCTAAAAPVRGPERSAGGFLQPATRRTSESAPEIKHLRGIIAVGSIVFARVAARRRLGR